MTYGEREGFDPTTMGGNESSEVKPDTEQPKTEVELLAELAASKARTAELFQETADIGQRQLSRKFEQELARLEAITLTGDLVEDIRLVAEVQGSIPPDVAQALEQADKNKLRQIAKEWLEGIDTYQSGAGASDQKVAPLMDNPAQQTMLAKKRELLSTILGSSK